MPDHIGSLSIKATDLPEIKDWKVGDKYTIQVEVEMTGLNKRRDWRSEDSMLSKPGPSQTAKPKHVMEGDFKIVSAKVPKKAQVL